MALTSPRPAIPVALYRREVWVVFFVLLVGASVDAASLPGQLLAVPAYLPMLLLDAFEAATGVSFGDAWDALLVVTYYVLAVLVAAGYVAIRRRRE